MRLLSVREEKLIAENEPELRKLKVLFGLYAFFIVASIIMPQYFGVHIGYDITCARFSILFFFVYAVFNPKVMTHFIQTMLRCEVFYPFCLYLFVAGYTMVLRTDINAFFLVFLEIFAFFMMVYGIRYVVGYRRAINWIIGCSYFLGVYGVVEFVYGESLFLKFFATVPTIVSNEYRSGQYRIMGPCGHSLGYGMVLILLIVFACIDLKKNEIYLFKRPVLLALLYVNVFLTGSRSTLGIAVLEIFIILLFSNRKNLKKSLFYLLIVMVGFVGVLLLIYNTRLGQYLMGQMASVIDQIFDTNFASKYGLETERLNASSDYREVLPKIFTLDWLNPLVGRGRGFGGAEIDGVFVHSVDNYYVVQYIKYAYPGLLSYILFMIVLATVLIRNLLQRGSHMSAVTKMVLIGCSLYFLNLWWVDALQTLKYVYIVIAVFYAAYFEERDNIEGKRKFVKKSEKHTYAENICRI